MIIYHENGISGTKGIIIKFKDYYPLWEFNYEHFKLVGKKKDFKTDIMMAKVTHPELPFKPQGEQYSEYWVDIARIEFPWLFADTNPLLYRKFYSRKSWYDGYRNIRYQPITTVDILKVILE